MPHSVLLPLQEIVPRNLFSNLISFGPLSAWLKGSNHDKWSQNFPRILLLEMKLHVYRFSNGAFTNIQSLTRLSMALSPEDCKEAN